MPVIARAMSWAVSVARGIAYMPLASGIHILLAGTGRDGGPSTHPYPFPERKREEASSSFTTYALNQGAVRAAMQLSPSPAGSSH